jgi:hypothetical protein
MTDNEEELQAARAEGAEAMRALVAQLDPYELHMAGAPFAQTISTPADIIRIMQDGIWSLPNPYSRKPVEDAND